jgi:hypothetical protein
MVSFDEEPKNRRPSVVVAPATPILKSNGVDIDYDATIAMYNAQIAQEKAGKRKLFHSLVKLATELKRVQSDAVPLQEQAAYANRAWYQGGMWRPPKVLPAVQQHSRNSNARTATNQNQRARLREAVSLSDLFFNLVIVTAFTRVGLAVAQDTMGGSFGNSGSDGDEARATTFGLTPSTFLYFAIFWTIWSKEASYSTRFDTTDLSAKLETLVTCFAVLFASLSVSAPLNSPGGTRIMIMAAFCALLHFGLYVRVYTWNWSNSAGGDVETPATIIEAEQQQQQEPDVLQNHVHRYAAFNMTMNLLEATNWILGLLFLPETSSVRWVVFVVGVLLALRIPRAFLANDFHGMSTKQQLFLSFLLF